MQLHRGLLDLRKNYSTFNQPFEQLHPKSAFFTSYSCNEHMRNHTSFISQNVLVKILSSCFKTTFSLYGDRRTVKTSAPNTDIRSDGRAQTQSPSPVGQYSLLYSILCSKETQGKSLHLRPTCEMNMFIQFLVKDLVSGQQKFVSIFSIF